MIKYLIGYYYKNYFKTYPTEFPIIDLILIFLVQISYFH